jgi:L-threonylcarbamoyladenylate synthase
LIVKRSELAADFVTGGQDTVGVRVPNHPVALGLLEAFNRIGGKGVAAPSANSFGHVSPTTAMAVEDELGHYLAPNDQILDGGPCEVGVESTIIDCTGDLPKILRPGAITAQMIAESTGLPIAGKFVYTDEDLPGISIHGETLKAKPVEESAIRVSGSLDAHYAPAATVLLDQVPVSGYGFIALAEMPTPEGVIRLAAPKTHEEFARLLYSALRAADEKGLAMVVVVQPVGDGIAVAIRDRLKRAAFGSAQS